MTKNDTQKAVQHYASLGWRLVAIPAGSKAPKTYGWQTSGTDLEYWDANPTHNVGILHSLSGTCAIDIDHMENTRIVCRAMNIDLDAILASAPRIVGRPDRGKALFKAPADASLTRRALSWPVATDPRRSEVVFELRAGAVMDVLPPSIHPDTGMPYRWAGASPSNGLPDLPEQLLTIWREWDRFLPQLRDVCPWKVKPDFTPPPPKQRRLDGANQSVIEAYNDAHHIGQVLEEVGYRKIGNRYLSPNSSTKMPGVVVFENGRAFSHHASDPFDPQHSFDAFDVFCHYHHLGNFGAAVKAASEALQIQRLPEGPTEDEREAQRHGAKIWATWQDAKKKDGTPDNDIPPHLLTVPGVLGQIVEYSSRTCKKPQPQFDVQTALAIGSVCMGRRFITEKDNMTSLFFVNLGVSGSGKEHANTVLERVLEASGLSHLIGPSGYTSVSGVISTLRDKPCHIAVIDELGRVLESAAARGNHNKKDSITALMQIWGRQTETFRGAGFATLALSAAQKAAMNVEIRNPSITLLCMSTPQTFWDALSSKDVEGGFVNRLLVVESKRPREVSRRSERIAPPDDVVRWCKAVANAAPDNAGNLSDNGHMFPPEPVYIPFSAEAVAIFERYERTIIDRQNDLPETLANMLQRTAQTAMRLALIVARSLGDEDVSEVSAQWAIDYADFYANQMIDVMRANMSEGDNDSLRKKVAAAIMQAGSAGLKMNELIDAVPRLGNLDKMRRDALLAVVCEDFPIERMKIKGTMGRPAIIHRKIIPE